MQFVVSVVWWLLCHVPKHQQVNMRKYDQEMLQIQTKLWCPGEETLEHTLKSKNTIEYKKNYHMSVRWNNPSRGSPFSITRLAE